MWYQFIFFLVATLNIHYSFSFYVICTLLRAFLTGELGLVGLDLPVVSFCVFVGQFVCCHRAGYFVFYVLFVLVWLSVYWLERTVTKVNPSPKCVEWDVKPYSVNHFLFWAQKPTFWTNIIHHRLLEPNTLDCVHKLYRLFCISRVHLFLSVTFYRQDLPLAALPVFRLLTGRFWGFSPRRGDTLHRSRSNLAGRSGP